VRTAVAAVTAAGLGFSMAACAAGADAADFSEFTPEAVAAALEEGGEISMWAWDPAIPAAVELFEELHPNVTVNLQNVGAGGDQYTALQNAIAAGTGLPDLAQIEYFILSQFTVTGHIADLTPFGAGDLDGTFTEGPWGAVTAGDGIFGLPLDGGAMALFYNATVLERYGLEVPTTWDEYMQLGRDLRAANPNIYIGSNGNTPNFVHALMRQAQGNPWTADGHDVSIDIVNDQGAQRFAEVWQPMIDDNLVSTIQWWTDEWHQALGNGTIATLVSGAWMPGNLISAAPQGSGHWRVAPMPQFEAGRMDTAETGGSSMTMTTSAQNPALAYAFMEFLAAGDGIEARLSQGGFPATVAELADEDFLNREIEYFGGQQINRVLADSANHVVPGWSWLPFMAYVNESFPETIGQAFIGNGTILENMAPWQERLLSFAETQGFTVN
jgi:multiple sugar transport system substrate-binding protein